MYTDVSISRGSDVPELGLRAKPEPRKIGRRGLGMWPGTMREHCSFDLKELLDFVVLSKTLDRGWGSGDEVPLKLKLYWLIK